MKSTSYWAKTYIGIYFVHLKLRVGIDWPLQNVHVNTPQYASAGQEPARYWASFH